MPSSITKDVPLAPHTTLAVGGSAEYVAEVKNEDDLSDVITWAGRRHLPVTVLGQGSNVLIADEGIPGVVVLMRIGGISYDDASAEEVFLTVGAGEDWDTLVHASTKRGLWGLENLSGIPGTVGAAPIQNINAYGASVADTIVRVSGFDRRTGKRITFAHDECGFGYRDSIFKRDAKDCIITEVTFRLSPVRAEHTGYRSSSQSIARYLEEKGIGTPAPEDIREAVLRARRTIGMLKGMYQSAGSFFTNTVVDAPAFSRIKAVVDERHAEQSAQFLPWYWEVPGGRVKVSTAFLMECTPYNKTDFREKMWRGTVGISPLHTLSVINAGGASAHDVKSFSDEIVGAVEKEFGIRIEPEVCMLP